jgi:predicted Zn-dependent protease
MQRFLKTISVGLASFVVALSYPSIFYPEHTTSLQLITDVSLNEAQRVTSEMGDRYRQARAEIPGDLYVYYRIIDRITRANQLDVPYWAITIEDNYQSVAYAAGAYVLSFDADLLNLMQGDVSAVAYVVAHEIAHHIHHHNAASIEFQRTLSEEMATMLSAANGFDRMIGEMMTVSESFDDRMLAFELGLELEAEETAIHYLTRAGFSPDSALSVFEVYENLYGTTDEMEARQGKIRSLLSERGASTDGEETVDLTRTQPMHYELLEEDTVLRVYQDPIDYATTLDEMFGE